MGIRVIKPGLLTTIQDLGRYGFQKSGMLVSGAMDTLALRIGNLLLGNPANEAGLEITFSGPTIIFEEDQLMAVTGGNLSPLIDGLPVAMWRPIYVQKGSVLSFGRAVDGCRSYLIIYGGFQVPEVMSSKSTYLRAEIGGWKGRAIKANDLLPFRKRYIGQLKKFGWSAGKNIYPDLSNTKIRVIKGPEFDQFNERSISLFFEESYTVSNESDRMGYRLKGPVLERNSSRELLSSAVTFGTVQVPAEGIPIILMADHQTTGGYPRIVQVISIDLTLLAQMQPGHKITFELITLAQAQVLLLTREQQLNQLQQTLNLKYD